MDININGQSYNTWDEVPEDIRKKIAAKLPDADGNGIPDVFEIAVGDASDLGKLAAAVGQPATTFSTIVVDGKQVSSMGQLPPEVQEMLQKTLGLIQPGAVAAPPPAMPAAPAMTAAPLQPGQIMLNGVPTVVGETAPPKKGFFRRLFGG